MNLASDTLTTIAILDDSPYLRGVERMARATEGVNQTAGLERIASGLTMAGAVAVGVGALMIKTASQFQQMQMSLKNSTGNDQLFQNLKSFTFNTPYTTSIWADQARMLHGFGVSAQDVIPVMKNLGDAVTGVFGVDPGRLAQLTYAYSEMNIGFANARHLKMFAVAGLNPYASVEKYLGVSENQAANIGKLHIPGKFVNAAIMQGEMDDPKKRDAMLKYMHSLKGEVSNLSDAWQIFMANAGTGALEPVSKGIHWLADEIKRLSDPGTSKSLGYMILFGGPAMLAAGPLVRAISLWKQMETAKKMASVASVMERNAELSKLPVLEEETGAVQTATMKWTALGNTLLGVATKAGVLYAAYAGIVGIKDLVDDKTATGLANNQFNAEFNNLRKDRKGALGDFIKDPLQNFATGIGDTFRGQGTARGQFDALTANANVIIQSSKDAKAIADFQRLLPALQNSFKYWQSTSLDTVQSQVGKVNEIVNETRNYNPADAAIAEQGNAANAARAATLAEYQKHKSEYLHATPGKPSAAGDPLARLGIDEDRAETLMKIAKIQGNSGAEAKYRVQAIGLIDKEISGLTRYAASIENVAGKKGAWLTAEKKILELMQHRAEFQEAEKNGDGRSKLDKVTAAILGAGGLGEDEILKRAGIGRGFFAGMSKGHLPKNPMKQAIEALAKRPLIVNFQIGDKVFGQVKKEIVDDALHALLRLSETSGKNALFGN